VKITYASAEIMAAIQAVQAQVQGLAYQLTQILQKETVMANNLEIVQAKVDALKADIAAGKTVQDSAIALLNGIVAQNTAFVQQIKDLIAAGGTPEQMAALVADFDATNAEMDAQRQELADAVTANTGT
jgi:hypothetical protein